MPLTLVTKDLQSSVSALRLKGNATGSSAVEAEVPVGAGLGLDSTNGVYWKPNEVQVVHTGIGGTSPTSWSIISGLTATINNVLATSKIKITVCLNCIADGGSIYFGRISRGSTPICVGEAFETRTRAGWAYPPHVSSNQNNTPALLHYSFTDEPSTAGSITYNIQAIRVFGSGNLWINRSITEANDALHGTFPCIIHLREIPV